MSVKTRQDEVARLQREIASLRKQDADQAKKESSISRNVEQTSRSLNTTRSESSQRSRRQRLVRLSDDSAKIQSKRADLEKKLLTRQPNFT